MTEPFSGSGNRLVLHHTSKTAGTSVHDELASFLAPERICPERGDNPGAFSYAALEEFDYFSGHSDKYNIDLIPSPKTVVTFLREPRQRIVSLYCYLRSYRREVIEAQDLVGHRMAKTLPLLDFLKCREPVVLLNIDNGLARSTLGRQRMETYRWLDAAEPGFYAGWALRNLERYHFVGFVERFDEDVKRLRDYLKLPPRSQEQHLNVFNAIATGEAEMREPVVAQRITPEILTALEALTRIDTLFYRLAFEQRMTPGCDFPW